MSLLTDADRQLIDGLRAGVCTGDGPCDSTPLGTGKNWVTETGGLDPYLRALAHAFQRKGKSESEAVQLAVGVAKRWAAGGGKVSAATRARAAKAVAHWEAQKAAAHGSRGMGVVTEGSSAGDLLPTVPTPRQAARVVASEMHAFRGRDLQSCGLCGQPAGAPIHLSKRAHLPKV